MNVIEALAARNIPSIIGDDPLRNGLSRFKYDEGSNLQPMTLLPVPSGNNNVDRSLTIKHKKVESVLSTMNKLVRRSLSIGATVDKVFRRIFSVREEEKLLRASRCCLSTTAGPIPGRLFISTLKLAFCSDRAIAKVVSPGPSSHMNGSLTLNHPKVESVLSTMNKLVKGKLGLGAKILKVGGIDKVFRRIFSIREEEQLLRACQCSLYTTAGPIPGRLFISTHKLAFCSDRPVAKVSSPDGGGSLRFH